MKFLIAREVSERYPDLRIGIVIARGITNAGHDPAVEDIRQNAILTLRERYTLETLGEHPHIRAWRDTYRSFGANPKQNLPTVEALARRIIRRKEIGSISKAVDLYIAAELNALLPIGGYDLHRIEGDIQLRLSTGAEAFTPIGKSEANQSEFTDPGEIVYSDTVRVLTRMWNYRDCDFAKITEQSTDVALFAEAPSPETKTKALEGLVEEMTKLIRCYCGSTVSSQLVTVKHGLEFSIASETQNGPAGGPNTYPVK
jgi:DNA/RNA-binding domain of Phe-tRNA-synthetase-like protein